MKTKQNNKDKGVLYIVSTPIGNLEDITLRALRILKTVDLIAAESVQYSRGLCSHYNINTRLTSYNQHNQKIKGKELIKRLKSGYNVALITNAGTPGVSDPGVLLVNQARENNIQVSPVPGPSAVAAALSVSGVRSDGFLFLGFLSNKTGRRRKQLQNLKSESLTMVFFEAPHRLQAMLDDLKEIFGDRQVVLLHELTKLHEEIKQGPVISIIEGLKREKIRGEFTLVVAGRDKRADDYSLDERTLKKIEKLLREDRMSLSDIAAKFSLEEGLTYRNVYKECLVIRNEIGSS
ncbi:MAG: 16S rRNA (cytidine(1402)-2'-O)-methyltransferase [Thermodesulfobacteriota bacterium]|nr:16S rRNA (cytidine(1402)-2'-O)-methyltransferase [Thermodesulfobacteriota bacterium]